jgi:trk system potassium uptake protein TrkH
MMGFTTGDGRGLPFMDALFTATSAVCVTGLIVVDTAVHFTPWGWAVIMVLIQIGGLGIMILSFFTIMTLRRRVSLADKVLLSYMLSEEDMMKIHRSLAGIVMTTFVIELAGAALLYVGFSGREGRGIRAVFFALFHAVSAFCNAGFALYSDSLEGFRGGRLVIATVSALIVSGGIGFAVIGNLRACLPPRLRHPFSPLRRRKAPALSLNSRIVLKYTAGLVIAGAAAVYFLEHGGAMKDYSLGDQYFSAFFQSVTLRTAGFNSIPFGSLRDATYMIMILFMFIGAASGSTAGGIKIGSLAVILSSLRAFMRGEKTPTLRNTSIPFERVSRAYLILLFGIGAVFLGTLVLTLTESASFLHLLFETVSAFGTVGLSAGVTGTLSPPGKLVIIMLMFFGRLGPLTILSAAGTSTETAAVSYPQCDIAIG